MCVLCASCRVLTSSTFSVFIIEKTQSISRVRAHNNARHRVHSRLISITRFFLQDVGQKIEPTECAQCGMVYNNTQSEDEQNHNKYHKRFLKASSFSVSPGHSPARYIT